MDRVLDRVRVAAGGVHPGDLVEGQVDILAGRGMGEGLQLRRRQLRLHERVLQLPGLGDVAAAVRRVGHRTVGQRTGGAQVQRPDLLAHSRIGVPREPVVQLHQVAVGVVVRSALGVRHRSPPSTTG